MASEALKGMSLSFCNNPDCRVVVFVYDGPRSSNGKCPNCGEFGSTKNA